MIDLDYSILKTTICNNPGPVYVYTTLRTDFIETVVALNNDSLIHLTDIDAANNKPGVVIIGKLHNHDAHNVQNLSSAHTIIDTVKLYTEYAIPGNGEYYSLEHNQLVAQFELSQKRDDAEIRDSYSNVFEDNNISDYYLIYGGPQHSYSFTRQPASEIFADVEYAIANNYNKIMFWNPDEPLTIGFLDKAQRIASQYPQLEWHYLSAGWHTQSVYNNICEQKGWEKIFKLTEANTLETCSTEDLLKDYDFFANRQYTAQGKHKLFLCYNKAMRYHRLAIVDRVLELGLLDRSLVSLNITPEQLTSIVEGYDHGILKEKLPSLLKHINNLPMRLDINEFDVTGESSPGPVSNEITQHIDCSYFSVVTETMFLHNRTNMIGELDMYATPFLTEKTYRCMAYKQPFILVTYPGMLATLKQQGYKTFSPYINETYDTVVDDDERLEAIKHEMLRLSLLTQSELEQLVNNVQDILEHNFNVLANKRISHSLKDL